MQNTPSALPDQIHKPHFVVEVCMRINEFWASITAVKTIKIHQAKRFWSQLNEFLLDIKLFPWNSKKWKIWNFFPYKPLLHIFQVFHFFELYYKTFIFYRNLFVWLHNRFDFVFVAFLQKLWMFKGFFSLIQSSTKNWNFIFENFMARGLYQARTHSADFKTV